MKSKMIKRALFTASFLAFAANVSSVFSQTEQKEFEKSSNQATEGYNHLQREKVKEEMRDKTHDGIRYKTGKDTSIGLESNPRGVSIKKKY